MSTRLQKIIGVSILSLVIFGSCALLTSQYRLPTINLDTNVVVIYTADWCSICETPKQFFKKYDIKYVELDYENEREIKRLLTIARQLNYTGELDGVRIIIVRKHIMVGFNPADILEILGKGKK